jgi:penicillin-binding protein 1A
VGNDDNRPMNKVVGGDLPADIWRRFMLAAEANQPARDFSGAPAAPAMPPASSEPAEAGSRAAFYQGLAQDFAEAQR